MTLHALQANKLRQVVTNTVSVYQRWGHVAQQRHDPIVLTLLEDIERSARSLLIILDGEREPEEGTHNPQAPWLDGGGVR